LNYFKATHSFTLSRGTVDGRDRPDALTWEKLASLRKFHVFLALLHLGAGAAMIVLSPAVTAPVFSVFADPTTRGQPSWAPVLARVSEINIGALSGAFLLLAGGHHLIAGTCARDAYEALLVRF
jgi:hypothetical protein